jgi:putative ABC transport system substrate-binding protein
MRRREFIAGLAGAVAWPLGARAQQPALPVIGWLDQGSAGIRREFVDAFRLGLAEMGFVEGRNVALEYRYADGYLDRLPARAADLILRRVAVIAAPSGGSAIAAKAATQSTPIVFTMGGDPVAYGLVASLDRPGGNLTGVAILGAEIAAKRLDLLHKLVPNAQSIAMLVGRVDSLYVQAESRDIQSAARALGVRLLLLNARNENDIAAAFSTLIEQKVGALLIGGSVLLDDARDQIISLAARHAIPAMFFWSYSASAGALLSYGPDNADASRQVGSYVGRILKGEKPADLPVVQATKFELAINLRTARALRLDIPPTLLAIADRVIE